MTKRLLIDAVHPEEIRVVLADESKLIEFEFESDHKKQIKSNIYLGKITRVEPSLQAAFVEYGGNKQGFLPFSEIHYDYFQIPTEDKIKIAKIIEAESNKADLDDEDDFIPNNVENIINSEPQNNSDVPPQNVAAEIIVDVQPIIEEPKIEPQENAKPERSENNFKKGGRFKRDRDRGGRDRDRNNRGGKFRRDRQFDESKWANYVPPFPFTEKDIPDLIRAEELAQIFEKEIYGENKFSESVGEVQAEIIEKNYEIINAEVEKSEAEKEFKPQIISEVVPQNEIAEIETQIISNIEEIPNLDDAELPNIAVDEEEGRESQSRHSFYRQYKIQEVIRRNQVVLVQVVKEERGNKGASLTTYLALAGRYCVFMPNTENGGGVSRRIASFSERRRIRTIVKSLEVDKGSSLIVRTAGMDKEEDDIKRDYFYLKNLWENIKKQTLESTAPALIYEESDIVKRSIRDLFKGDVEEVLIEGDASYNSAINFIELTSPHQKDQVKNYKGQIPLFQKFRIEERLDELFEREIKLESGGSIVITPTEALVSIDVNSGRATKERSVEDTAYKTNLEAAREIARQLRLRDLAGLVVIDFIDMREVRNRKAIERELKDALRSDRAKIQIGRISTFGLLEMSRQRISSSLIENSSECCPMCNGLGAVRSTESLALKLIRKIEGESGRKSIREIYVRLSSHLCSFIKANRIADIKKIEQTDNVKIFLEEDYLLLPNQFDVSPQKSGHRKPHQQNYKNNNYQENNKPNKPSGLTLEEFEANNPDNFSADSSNENQAPQASEFSEVERKQFDDEKDYSNQQPRNNFNKNRNRRRNRNRRNGRFDNRQNNNNNYQNIEYLPNNNSENSSSNQRNNRNNNVENFSNAQEIKENQNSNSDKPKSSKLLGLWKKITS